MKKATVWFTFCISGNCRFFFFLQLPEDFFAVLINHSYQKINTPLKFNILLHKLLPLLFWSELILQNLPESTEQERFQRHNRFLRSLKSDTLLIIDNFNVTATQDSFLSVVLKYRCQILFTTRGKLDEYCTLPLKEIEDMNALFQLASAFYSKADTYRATVEKIIETVHSHTFAVELAAKLLENGISTPD